MILMALVSSVFAMICWNRYVLKGIPVYGSVDWVVWGAAISFLAFLGATYLDFKESLGAEGAGLILAVGLFVFLVMLLYFVREYHKHTK